MTLIPSTCRNYALSGMPNHNASSRGSPADAPESRGFIDPRPVHCFAGSQSISAPGSSSSMHRLPAGQCTAGQSVQRGGRCLYSEEWRTGVASLVQDRSTPRPRRQHPAPSHNSSPQLQRTSCVRRYPCWLITWGRDPERARRHIRSMRSCEEHDDEQRAHRAFATLR